MKYNTENPPILHNHRSLNGVQNLRKVDKKSICKSYYFKHLSRYEMKLNESVKKYLDFQNILNLKGLVGCSIEWV